MHGIPEGVYAIGVYIDVFGKQESSPSTRFLNLVTKELKARGWEIPDSIRKSPKTWKAMAESIGIGTSNNERADKAEIKQFKDFLCKKQILTPSARMYHHLCAVLAIDTAAAGFEYIEHYKDGRKIHHMPDGSIKTS